MISASGEDIAYAMCGGCPVPEEVQVSYCHKWKGMTGLERGNLCLLREISRNQAGPQGSHIIRLTTPRTSPSLEVRDRHHQKQPEPAWVTQEVVDRPTAMQVDCKEMFHALTRSLGVEASSGIPIFINITVTLNVPVNSVPRVLAFFDKKGVVSSAVKGSL